MVFSLKDNSIDINGHQVIYDQRIVKALETTSGNILILKEIPIESDELNNVYCHNERGQLVWQISPSDFEKTGKPCYAYEGLSVCDEGYFAVDFYGRRFFFDPETGHIFARDAMK